MEKQPSEKRPLSRRIEEDGLVILSGGYLFEVERRGYIKAGEFVPKVAVEHPEVLEEVTSDFVRSGSDVALAFTYNGHREKMRIIGEEHLLEPLNREALRIAKRVAENEAERAYKGEEPLVAGNISNSNIFDPDNEDSKKAVREMYREMVTWAKEEGADFIQAETLYYYEEALIALEEIKRAGLEGVINVAVFAEGKMRDGYSPETAVKKLYEAGADVVGTNCFRGPHTMLPILRKMREALPDAPLSALPVAYRTSEEHPTFFNLPDDRNTAELPNGRAFPDALEGLLHNRYEMADFAREAARLGIAVVGICCGNSVVHNRALAEALGRRPYLSRYSPDLTKHFLYGSDETLKKQNTEYGDKA